MSKSQLVFCLTLFTLVTELHWLQMENSGVVHMLKNKKTDGEYLKCNKKITNQAMNKNISFKHSRTIISL